MNNDERIRRWRKERLPEVAAGLADDDLDDLKALDPAAFEASAVAA